MLIAIDYDDTYTADPEFWRGVIELGQRRGHRFVIVTAKDHLDSFVQLPVTVTICTDGEAKRLFAAKCGLLPDVWIDDLPESVGMSTLAALNQVHVKGK